jgi:hypothetical protein
MWHRETDGTYVTEISEFSRNPTNPTTGDPIMHASLALMRLVPHIQNEEIAWWYGTLVDGTRVLIYND